MLLEQIPIEKTGYWSATALAYLRNEPAIRPFYHYTPEASSLDEAIRQRQFSPARREVLVEALLRQYADSGITLQDTDPVYRNIISLKDSNTFAITTGQQIHIFLGPLFVLYKIAMTVQLAGETEKRNPGKKVVPVFWMASEDHDIEEINRTSVFGNDYTWQPGEKGPVGRLATSSLVDFILSMEEKYTHDERVLEVLGWFKEAYLQGKTLARATRHVLHRLTGSYGLVILDPDDAALKAEFIPAMLEDILSRRNHDIIQEQSAELREAGYSTQVNPRAINHFYMEKGLRERIVEEEGLFRVLNTDIKWTAEEIREKVNSSPASFSPNVVMRPLYQESILPDLCYVPGSNELVYWLQLYNMFRANETFFPVLWPRNSVLIINDKKQKMIQETGMVFEQLFLPEQQFKSITLQEIGVVISAKAFTDGIKKIEQEIYSVLKPAGVQIKELVEQFKTLNGQVNRAFKEVEVYYLNRQAKKMEKLNIIRGEVLIDGAQERKQMILTELLKNKHDIIGTIMLNTSPLLGLFHIIKI